ncbi:MAG TPA: hypothetical protein VHA33_07645 [Candidatus Angelobacter sp.]|nr:hypothetical protein [Candidatus Angelobacter sp.]
MAQILTLKRSRPVRRFQGIRIPDLRETAPQHNSLVKKTGLFSAVFFKINAD